MEFDFGNLLFVILLALAALGGWYGYQWVRDKFK